MRISEKIMQDRAAESLGKIRHPFYQDGSDERICLGDIVFNKNHGLGGYAPRSEYIVVGIGWDRDRDQARLTIERRDGAGNQHTAWPHQLAFVEHGPPIEPCPRDTDGDGNCGMQQCPD